MNHRDLLGPTLSLERQGSYICGLFGAIGTNVDTGIVRALAIANRERGKQSLGLFDSNGKAVKAGIDPYKALANSEFSAFMTAADKWFIAGHTRHATQGKINDTNAHPFRYGNVIGAHNGVVSAPKDYAVDSEYLIDQLHKHNGDYQTAFADIRGYWGLSWFDGSAFYLQAHNNEVAVGLAADNNYYYSSDAEHLAACIGTADKVCILSKGQTARFSDGLSSPVMLPDFMATDKAEYDRWSWQDYDTRQLPQHYRESKSERKRRKKEQKAQRDGYGVSSNRISHDEFDLGNAMAQECGYRDLSDFMWRENCENESAAFRMLQNAVDNSHGGSSLWMVNDERADVAGLDTIPT